MALTTVATTDLQRVVLFMEKVMATEAEKKMFMKQFMGPDSDSAIQKIDALSKGPGDKITYQLRLKLTGRGRYGDAQLEGNEEGIVIQNDSLQVDLLRHAAGRITVMSQKRTFINYSRESAMALAVWFAEWADECLFIYLAGHRGDNEATGKFALSFTGFAGNAIQAPSSNHTYYAGNTTLATLAPTNKLGLDDFDQVLVNIAELQGTPGTPGMRPLNIGGQPRYLLITSPRSKYDAIQGPASDTLMERINLAEIQGGNKEEFIFSDGLAYSDLVIYSSMHTRKLTSTSNLTSYAAIGTSVVTRSLVLGAQAAVIGYGEPNGGFDNIKVKRQVFDYENQEAYAAGLILGMKKVQFTNDLGVYAIDAATAS